MDYRRPQHPRHGMYHPSTPYVDIQNQSDSMTYSQCHPNYNDNSPWVLWRDRTSSPEVSLKKGKCCSAVLGIAVFLAILTVMGIAGLAIYMGALKLDSAQYLVFDGSLRVTSGDAYNPSLSDRSNELYKKKFQFYKMLLQTIFKNSELGAALKQSTITGFAKGSLIVFFRLILDRRKVPKPLTNLEERARIIILQEFNSIIPSLPLQNLKIDANQVYIRRHFEGTYKGPDRSESDSSEKNTSFQIKNGVLLKTPLHSQSPKHKSTQSEHLITNKPKKPEIGLAHGSFVISSSETPIVENTSSEKPKYTTERTTNTQTSINTPSIQTRKTKPSLSNNPQSSHVTTTETLANRLQHSPALNALLMHKQTTQKPVESTQPNKISLDSDLITLLPYNFQHAEEPWKPVLPENFTRYPQRRPPPTTTEDYSSEGVGVVEVVLDPEDIDKVYSKTPLRIEEPITSKIKTEFLNLNNPLEGGKNKVAPGLRQSDFSSNEKSIFGPRSNDKISSFALHIESSDSHSNKEPETSITHTNGGDIVRRLENLQDYNNKLVASKISPLSQYLPDFPIIQEFHNLDTLLRSYNIRSTPPPYNVPHHDAHDEKITKDFEESSTADLPITLLPVRSNSGIGKPLRPRPTVGSINFNSRMHFIKLASSLTPDPEQKEIQISNESKNLSKTYKDLQSFVQDITTSDYTSITNYFDSFLATITPTDLEDSYKYKNREFEILNQSSYESITYPEDYLTDSTEIITQTVDTTNKPNVNKERTMNKLQLISHLSEEILTTTEVDSNTYEVTRNIHNKTHSDIYRKPKMATQFSTIVLPIKLLSDKENLGVKEENGLNSDTSNSTLNKNIINDHFGSYLELPVNVHSINLNTNNNSKLLGNLKDNSMEDYLEKVIYNISTETPDDTDNAKVSDSTASYFPYFFAQLNDSANDTNLASNRKYEKADRNSITMDTSSLGLISNLSFPYNSFRDDWNRNVTKKSNDSLKTLIESQNILKISTQLMHSGLNGNHKEEETPTKNVVSSNHYVVNKNGFSILTKVFNKVPEQVETSTVIISLKNNVSECYGNLSLQCGTGECVSALSRCNHLVDCTDGSDEKNCTCAEFLQSQFLTRKICDGVVDCWDFSDENNCDWCVPGQYVCTNSRVCVDRDRLCDGERDCPNGDDERNCVSITPDIPQANTMAYNSEGYLMIRKNGQWGKLCTENFDSLNYNFKSLWSMEDLGKAVCKALTFRKFENASIINDRVFNQSSYFELSFSKGTGDGHSARMGFSFAKTNCSKKEVIHVSCSDLECGIRPQANSHWTSKRLAGSTRHSRIVGGGNAGPGSWPWQAALYKEGEFQCGATLISDKWLLSAGHCFYHALDDYWVARLGALRRGTSLPSPYEQLQPVSRIILHPGYVDSGFINDISLLEMRNPVSFTNYVRPICLPQPTMQVKDGTLCTVVGWGQLFEVGRIFPDTLQEVQLPIISTAECRKRTLFLPLYRVTENMFCAGYDRGGRDACLGDSGGPLMCQEVDGRWSLVGVTSNGYGCARANRPGVYTKVSNYVNWVKLNMASVNNSSTHKQNLTCNGHRCPLGECLPPARICNGYMECSDGSDEKDCW